MVPRPEEAAQIQEQIGGDWPFEFLGSRELGGTAFLDGMWKRLGIDRAIKALLKERAIQTPIERLLFAMTANRALGPSSKLHMEHWVAEKAYIEGLTEVQAQQLYRAMDFLLEAHYEIRHDVFFSVANLFNLEVDLLFLDTCERLLRDRRGGRGRRKRRRTARGEAPQTRRGKQGPEA